MLQLQDALTRLTDDPALRTIVLTGADPAFCAGGDLEMIAGGSRAIRDATDDADTSDAWRWIRHRFGAIVRTITRADQLVVAAVNGPAAGVGLAFALSCDVLLCSERAVLVPAFGRLGLVPEVGTSWLLTRRLGYQGAMALYVRGRHVGAEEALRLGLAQEVHPHDELLAAAARWCDDVERMPAHALPMSKAVLRGAADATWEDALRLEEMAEANCFSTAALSEAADALRRR
jgi:2-(1,2-epoxy-1,2-dihydrophenyl)acetyl-CoA isomerase